MADFVAAHGEAMRGFDLFATGTTRDPDPGALPRYVRDAPEERAARRQLSRSAP
jgi:hypothetical protein